MEAEPGPAVLKCNVVFLKAEAWLISCSTGCSCCSGENHVRGPFRTREVAEARVALYHEIPLLASQYSRTGNYYIEKAEAEVLPDGRLIIDGRVCSWFVVNDLAAGLDEEVFSR